MRKYLFATIALFFIFGCQYNKPNEKIEILINKQMENMKESTVVVFSPTPDGKIESSTGFVVYKKENKSYVMASNHGSFSDIIIVERSYINSIDVSGVPHNGKVLKHDLQRDIAIIEVDSSLPLTKIVKLKKDELPAIGSEIYIVGFPQSTPSFVSRGFIGKYSTLDNITKLETTAPIDFGDSGGPVFSKNGEVIGISTEAHKNNLSMTAGVTSIEIIKWMKKEKLDYMIN